jgi:Xaa-Pro aminopeptidase
MQLNENIKLLPETGVSIKKRVADFLSQAPDTTLIRLDQDLMNMPLPPKVTDEMKADFTRVCRSNLNLANARFLYGCTGVNLDVLARQPLWEANLDYKHGTGHGVGHILNVHEGPNGFHWGRKSYTTPLEEGMITTDEPGIYIEGKYGIRLENELICHKGEKNEFGQFMYFENITFVPMDLDVIDPSRMNETEKRYLNEYHKAVYEKVSPLLTEEEAEWLKEYTREI